jgi:cyclophilin family peptidyl-prolyl cis-trans isomerase
VTRRPWPLHRLAGFALAVGVTAILMACSGSAPSTQGPAGSCPTSQPAALAAADTRTVTIQTEKGSIVIKVVGALSPIAAGNFVALASCGFYDGVVFHRVVPDFVIQGGDGQFGKSGSIDQQRVGSGGPGYTIADEPVTATYARGTVAMARTSQPNSQGSQFFIVLADSAASSLSSANTYAIFGTVTSGMDAVDAIAAAADNEIPSHPIAMTKVTVAAP